MSDVEQSRSTITVKVDSPAQIWVQRQAMEAWRHMAAHAEVRLDRASNMKGKRQQDEVWAIRSELADMRIEALKMPATLATDYAALVKEGAALGVTP
mgnify:CR=1 FL=1